MCDQTSLERIAEVPQYRTDPAAFGDNASWSRHLPPSPVGHTAGAITRRPSHDHASPQRFTVDRALAENVPRFELHSTTRSGPREERWHPVTWHFARGRTS
jgi:hypothetical protein